MRGAVEEQRHRMALELASGDLVVGGPIAEGEFAEVFRGLLWGQKVAVKQLKKREGLDAQKILAEMWHEVEIMSMLHHPGVLTLIGAVADPSQPLLVLEYLDCTL